MASGKILVYGLNPVLEALKSGRALRIFLGRGRKEGMSPLLKLAEKAGVPVESVKPDFFARFPKGHQSVAARVREKEFSSIEEILENAHKKGEAPFLVALDGVEDPRNMGSIMRTAVCAGAHGMILQEHREAALGPEVYKSSAGALEYLPVSMQANIKYALDELKNQEVRIYCAEAGKGLAPWDVDLTVPLVTVFGGEHAGIRKIIKERADQILALPVRGEVGSLNVSVAAGVFLYEILRQRSGKSE